MYKDNDLKLHTSSPFRYTPDSVFFNSKCKVFPDGSKTWSVCNEAIYKADGFEYSDDSIKKAIENRPEQYCTDGVSRSDNVSRARRRVFEIAKCNNFELFVTLTLDSERIDRYNVEEVKKAVRKWLNNMTQRKGIKYLLVPELHEDGALHFHALITKGSLKLIDSGHKDKKGHTVYNLPQWKYGFSTAIETYGDFDGACKYISKYITKDTDKKIFGQFYLSGGKGLVLEPQTELYNLDFLEFGHLKQYSCEVLPDRKFVYPLDEEVRFSLGEIIEL